MRSKHLPTMVRTGSAGYTGDSRNYKPVLALLRQVGIRTMISHEKSSLQSLNEILTTIFEIYKSLLPMLMIRNIIWNQIIECDNKHLSFLFSGLWFYDSRPCEQSCVQLQGHSYDLTSYWSVLTVAFPLTDVRHQSTSWVSSTYRHGLTRGND